MQCYYDDDIGCNYLLLIDYYHLQMPKQIELVKQLIDQLQNNANYSYSPDLQSHIINAFSDFMPSHSLFRLAALAIQDFGFGVLLSLRPLYHALTSKAFLQFKNEIAHIEMIVTQLMGSSDFSQFQEISFLRHSTKQQRRVMAKVRGQKKEKNFIWKRGHDSSDTFIKHLLKIKAQIVIIERMNGKENGQLSLIFSSLKQCLSGTSSFNAFQKKYHCYQINKVIDALKSLKQRWIYNSNDTAKIDTVIQLLERGDQSDALSEVNEILSEKSSDFIPFSSHSQRVREIATFQRSAAPNNQNAFKSNPQPHPLIQPYLKLKLSQQQSPLKQPPIDQTQKEKSRETSNFMCCKRFFYENQIIEEAESIRREYKFYNFPFNPQKNQALRKTIVGFLNSVGGIIYLGIKEQTNRVRKAVGITLNQREKEELLTAIRQVCEGVVPDIIFSRLFQVKFVPLKSSNNSIVGGKCIVKIIVEMGKPKELYYTNTHEQGAKVAIRTENQVLVSDPKTELNKIIEIVKNRLLQPPRKPIIDHDWQCPEPLPGLGVYGQK